MTLNGIFGVGKKFLSETRANGFWSALRKSIKGVASRSGMASLDDLEPLNVARQSLTDQLIPINDQITLLTQQLSHITAQLSVHQQAEREIDQRVDALKAELGIARATIVALEEHNALRRGETTDARFETQRIAHDVAKLQTALTADAASIGWLAKNHWTTRTITQTVTTGPLVSVIIPVWNREHLVRDAIRSVQGQIYQNWELIIVDDGSTDGTRASVAEFLDDRRIKYLPVPHQGVSVARNIGVANSQGELIAYLDSDDIWFPAFLSRMVSAFAETPERDWAYAAKLFSDLDGPQQIFHLPVEPASLLEFNAVPMNALMHRRSLFDQVGGFDEDLERLVDWDLVLRFNAVSEPLVVQVIGGQLRRGSWPRITNQKSHSLAYYQVRRKHVTATKKPVRILYALQFFPQLSETFVNTEIATLRQKGVEISVWSQGDPPVPYEADVPVFRGNLADAIATVRPAMVHTHSLYHALLYSPMVQPTGVPMTVRGHGFEFTEESLRLVSQTENIRGVFEFPHFITGKSLEGVDQTKLRATTACFNPELYFPKGTQDRRLVVRTGLASPSKDLSLFFKVAAKCPRHRFVLVPCWSVGYPGHLDELRELNRSLGEPVEIIVNRPHAEVATLLQGAGIYLHTHSLVEPYGMPVSIAESMAAGCYVVARRCAASIDYVGNAGKTYDTEAEATALILETERWTEHDWEQARLNSIERAFANYASPQVLQPLLDEWTSAQVGSFTATA